MFHGQVLILGIISAYAHIDTWLIRWARRQGSHVGADWRGVQEIQYPFPMAVPFTTYLHPERYKHNTGGKTAIFAHPRSKVDICVDRRTCALAPHGMWSRLNGCDIERYFVLPPKSNKA